METQEFLSLYEWFLILLLGGICAFIITSNWLKRDSIMTWSPLTMLSVILMYYGVAGPIITILTDSAEYKLIDHRPFFHLGWELLILGYLSTILGFNISGNHKMKRPNKTSWLKDQRLNKTNLEKSVWRPLVYIALSCIIMLVGTGGLLGQIDITRNYEASLFSGTNTTLGGYLLNGINLLIGACLLLLVNCIRTNKGWWMLIALLIFTFAVYTRQGFRWRHITLLISMACCYYIYTNSRFRPVIVGILGILVLGVMGFIGLTRSYGGGLDFSAAQGTDNSQYLLAGFSESSVFLTSSLLVEKSSQFQDTDYIGMSPILQSVYMPIPRAIWPSKPSGDYLSIVVSLYDEVFEDNGLGAAVFNYGEYYLMYGWSSLMLFGFFLGVIFKRVWQWFLKHRTNKLAIVTYAIFFAYIYMIISRGYTPQVVMLFCFTVLPLYLIFDHHYKKVKIRRSQLAHS